MKSRIAVETPAYGLNAPDGSETIPSSFWSSTRMRRSSLWAFEEPNSHTVWDNHCRSGRRV